LCREELDGGGAGWAEWRRVRGSASGGLRRVLRGRQSSSDDVGGLRWVVWARRDDESEESEREKGASSGREGKLHGVADIYRERGRDAEGGRRNDRSASKPLMVDVTSIE
jgi:hypothetical protein